MQSTGAPLHPSGGGARPGCVDPGLCALSCVDLLNKPTVPNSLNRNLYALPAASRAEVPGGHLPDAQGSSE
eukprot:scaffold87926_cov40-Phaeocystis_antarctica.AAC.1